MYLATAKDVQSRKAELVDLVAGGKQTDSQIRSAEMDMVFHISDYIGGGAWTVVDGKSGVRSVALGNMPHADKFAKEVGVAFDIVEETMKDADGVVLKSKSGADKVRRYSQITGKSETMYLLLGKLAHPWVRDGFGLVCDETTKSYGCSNWFSGFTSNLWAPFVSSVKKVAGDNASKSVFKITNQSLSGIPEEVVMKLQSLRNPFVVEGEFLEKLDEAIGADSPYRLAILENAKSSVLKETALELLSLVKLLTIDKETQSGNNVSDMEQRVKEFKTAIEGSSFAGVKIDYQKLSASPKKSEFLRDVFNAFSERKAKTKKTPAAAAVEAEDVKKIKAELGIDAEADITGVITDIKAKAEKYNDVVNQFALSVDVNIISDEKVDETIAMLENAHKDLLAQADKISNQVTTLQNRLAQSDKIESVKKSLLAMGIDEQTAKVLAIQSLSNEAVQKMLSNGNGGEQSNVGRGKGNKKGADSEDADKSA